MLARDASLLLFVDDHDAVRAFYSDILGLFELQDGELIFRAAPAFRIHTTRASNEAERAMVGKQSAGDVPLLAFEVDSCDAMLERLQTSGVPLEDKDIKTGRYLDCHDPAGNRVRIYQDYLRQYHEEYPDDL